MIILPMPGRGGARRSPLVAALVAATLIAAPVRAAPSPPAPPTAAVMADFEAGFNEGEALFNRGDFLAAARRWTAAADLLAEITVNREQRVAINEYIADAYTRALVGSEDAALLREAADGLHRYCAAFTRAYGITTPVPAKILTARDDFKTRFDAVQASRKTPPPPPPVVDEPIDEPADEPIDAVTDRPTKPWQPLAIGGGLLVGVGALSLGGAVIAAVQGKKATRDFNAMCFLDMQDTPCMLLYDRGRSTNIAAGALIAAGVVLLAAGIPMLAVAMKRKRAERHTLTPEVHRGFVGLSLRGSF